jgi:phosphoribosyl 1,2-cyclic phosphodiesterase
MRVTFWGVRGSTPVAGPDFIRVGGHTSCIAIARGDELPTLVLDAGTGLQPFASVFGASPFRGTILLTHLHWDHMQGLPFFPPADQDDAEVTVVQPAQGDPVATLARSMSPPHFPIGPDGLRGVWKHVGIDPGSHTFANFEIVAGEVQHKGGRAFGYRISCDGASMAYVPDALDANDDAIVALARGVDVLVRGAPFLAEESERANLYGHGTIEHAIEVARAADARRLIVTHHGPYRSDDALDAIGQRFDVEMATEGLRMDVLPP